MHDLFKQFFDRTTWFTLLGLAIVHGVAALVIGSSWSWLPLVIVGVAALVITLRSLPYGLAFALLEIFIGGHGHLITADAFGFSVGIRMIIFAGVMLGWLILMIRRRIGLRVVPKRDLPWALLGAAIIIGFISGLVRNGFGPAFDDMNGYLMLGYLLPVWSVAWTPERKRLLLQTLCVSAIWIATTTLLLFYLFTHLPGEGIHSLYVFVRDARLVEATILSNPQWLVGLLPGGPWFFRVFQQSQFVVLAFELVLVAAAFFVAKTKWPKHVVWLHALLMTAIIGSMSRSFWLGFIVALAMLFVAGIVDRVPLRSWMSTKLLGVIAGVIALLALWSAVAIPLPTRPDLSDSPYYRGDDDDTRNLAVSSRWNLLGPMMTAIGNEPIWGSGFGTAVTFISDDPRLRAVIPSGEWTTYRFEWGYQDIWLKMGVPGIIAFLWLLGVMLYAVWQQHKEKSPTRWMTIGLVAGAVALYVTHIFSPYLNHPIGLGYLILIVPFLRFSKTDEPSSPIIAKEKLHTSSTVLEILSRPHVGVVTREQQT